MYFNDSYIRQLFQRQFRIVFDSEVLNNGISELKVASSSRVTEKLSTGKFDYELRTNYRLLKHLSADQKIDLYIILRILRLSYPENERLKLFLFDLEEIFKKKQIDQNDRYFYLSHLDDKYFELFIFDLFLTKKNLRFFARRIHQKIPEKDNQTILEILISWLQSPIRMIFISRQKPKKLQRHKGYRDHGSLGSDYSKTRKDQSTDWTVREEMLEQEAREDTYLPLIKGFLE